MTFKSSAWAIDGARLGSAIARTQTYAVSGGAEGVSALTHLKVTQLTTPDAGFKVAAGGALIINRYQASPSQTYTVLNDASIDVTTGIPGSSAGAVSHLVCVVVGDQGDDTEGFSQVGHPFMLSSDPPAGQEETFQYVRIVVIPNVPATTKTFAQLGLSYPGYALARVDLPAGVTTYTDARIVDLRKVARPREYSDTFNASVTGTNALGNVVNVYENWPTVASWSVDIPIWATEVQVMAVVEGARKTLAGQGSLQVNLSNVGSSAPTNIDEDAPGGARDRKEYTIIGKIPIALAQRGTTQTIRIQGKVNTTASKNFLTTDTNTSAMLQVRFRETAT